MQCTYRRGKLENTRCLVAARFQARLDIGGSGYDHLFCYKHVVWYVQTTFSGSFRTEAVLTIKEA